MVRLATTYSRQPIYGHGLPSTSSLAAAACWHANVYAGALILNYIRVERGQVTSDEPLPALGRFLASERVISNFSLAAAFTVTLP
jgi:hypothetical protein